MHLLAMFPRILRYLHISTFSLTEVSLLPFQSSIEGWGVLILIASCRDVLICGDDVPELHRDEVISNGINIEHSGLHSLLTRWHALITVSQLNVIPHQPFNQKPAICKSVDYWSQDLSSQFTASVSKAIMSVWMSWGYHINSLQSRNKCLKQYIL